MYGIEPDEEYKPWLWQVPDDGVIGKDGVLCLDAWDKVSGRGIYARDRYLPGTLYAKYLRSPYPHAKINSIDVSKTEALQGVRAVFTYSEKDMWDGPLGSASGKCYARYGRSPVIGNVAFYYGQPIGAVVVAESELLVDEGLRLLEIDWDVLPFCVDFREMLEPNAPILLPEVTPDSNIQSEVIVQYGGDAEAALKEAPNLIDVTFHIEEDEVAQGHPCDTVQYLGQYPDTGIFELWSQNQSWTTYQKQNFFSKVPWLPVNRLIYHSHHNVAQFGGHRHDMVTDNHVIAVDIARALAERGITNQPIKLLTDVGFYQPGDHYGLYQMTIGFKDNGEITAVKETTYQCMDYTDQIDKIHKASKIPNLYLKAMYVAENRGITHCYKHGDGACTSHTEPFDQVAAALGMDPTEVALINDGCKEHDMEWVNENVKKAQGFDYTRDSLKEVLAMGKDLIDWNNKWHQPGTKILPNGNYHGIGFTWQVRWAHGPGSMSVGLRMERDGTVIPLSEFQDIGVHRSTTYTQVIASELGVKYEDVIFREFQTDPGFELNAPGGSSGMCINLPCLVRVARKLRQLILEKAVSPRPGSWGGPDQPPFFPDMAADDLNMMDGEIFEKADPSNKITVKELAAAHSMNLFAWDFSPTLTDTQYDMLRQAYFAEVEVDPDTGQVQVQKVVVVADAGQVINVRSWDCQLFGGVYMGISRSNQEQIIYDPIEGVRLNDNHIGYPIVLMNDIPEGVVRGTVETHFGYSAYGACGIGENPAACTASLTRNAVHNAIGKWVDLKTTPE
ncbi:MAG: molybdopterin-dependent oxidoreductase, partial [Candidatus Bathyarchaeota archaeon]|nr:molybdopterin-dependent oxidoreductase [Candidatus Bathyarchaeota archaeon]